MALQSTSALMKKTPAPRNCLVHSPVCARLSLGLSSREPSLPPRHIAAAASPSVLPSRHVLCRSSSDDENSPVPEAVVGSLEEINKDNYWDVLKSDENKGKVVVVDCYTDWCGPCKMIYPSLVKLDIELSEKGTGKIVKFNCNKYNKDLGVQLKIKVAPTFLLYRDGEKVGEMTGAKLDKLKGLIDEKINGPAAV